jgi:hypothetical protein
MEQGDWDYITEEGAAAAMERLVECVRYCAALPERMRGVRGGTG